MNCRAIIRGSFQDDSDVAFGKWAVSMWGWNWALSMSVRMSVLCSNDLRDLIPHP